MITNSIVKVFITVKDIFVTLFQVYLCLFRTYITPPDSDSLHIMETIQPPPEPNINAALEVLEFHHDKIDTAKVKLLILFV